MRLISPDPKLSKIEIYRPWAAKAPHDFLDEKLLNQFATWLVARLLGLETADFNFTQGWIQLKEARLAVFSDSYVTRQNWACMTWDKPNRTKVCGRGHYEKPYRPKHLDSYLHNGLSKEVVFIPCTPLRELKEISESFFTKASKNTSGADLFVLALQNHENCHSWTPFATNQWEFYLVTKKNPAKTLPVNAKALFSEEIKAEVLAQEIQKKLARIKVEPSIPDRPIYPLVRCEACTNQVYLVKENGKYYFYDLDIMQKHKCRFDEPDTIS